MSLGTAASGEADAGQRGGRAHKADEVAAGETILITTGGGIRELAAEPLREGSGSGALLERTPEDRIGLAGRMGKDLLHR
jgi:3'-phosphoadenosine 5'-phosphosulfate (PAPS) 3'-phosphatase